MALVSALLRECSARVPQTPRGVSAAAGGRRAHILTKTPPAFAVRCGTEHLGSGFLGNFYKGHGDCREPRKPVSDQGASTFPARGASSRSEAPLPPSPALAACLGTRSCGCRAHTLSRCARKAGAALCPRGCVGWKRRSRPGFTGTGTGRRLRTHGLSVPQKCDGQRARTPSCSQLPSPRHLARQPEAAGPHVDTAGASWRLR